MDYLLAATANRKRIARIVASMVLMMGGLSVRCVARHVHLAVLAILRPAESSARRLIAVLAHGLAATVPGKKSTPPDSLIPKSDGTHSPAFVLIDPRRNVDLKEERVLGYGPNVSSFDESDRRPPPPAAGPQDDDLVDPAAVIRRLKALLEALDDLPCHARRLARALSKKALPIRAMRPGRPPGYRSPSKGGRWRHPVDELLTDCHDLALMALNEPVPP